MRVATRTASSVPWRRWCRSSREIHENVLEARLRRSEMEKPPFLLDDARREALGIGVVVELDAVHLRIDFLDRGGADRLGELACRRRVLQAHDEAPAAVQRLERGDRVAVDDAAMVQDLHPVAD